MNCLRRLLRSTQGNAAAEMALCAPLLVILLVGSFELGKYFMDEHVLVKAVRDAARYASRQDFSNYSTCSGSVSDPLLGNIQNVVKQGLVSDGSDLLDWNGASIDVTMSCSTMAIADDYGSQSMSGIYIGQASGAPIVTITANVPYVSIFGGVSLSLNASQQAAVTGI